MTYTILKLINTNIYMFYINNNIIYINKIINKLIILSKNIKFKDKIFIYGKNHDEKIINIMIKGNPNIKNIKLLKVNTIEEEIDFMLILISFFETLYIN